MNIKVEAFCFDPRHKRGAKVRQIQREVAAMPPLPTLPDELRAKGQTFATGTVEETLWLAEGGPKKFLSNKGWVARTSDHTKSSLADYKLKICNWQSLSPQLNEGSSKILGCNTILSARDRQLRRKHETESADLVLTAVLAEIGDTELYQAVLSCSDEAKEKMLMYIRALYASILGTCRHAFDDMSQCCCFEKQSNLVRAQCLKRKELAKRLKYPDIKSDILRMISPAAEGIRTHNLDYQPESDQTDIDRHSPTISLLRKALVS